MQNQPPVHIVRPALTWEALDPRTLRSALAAAAVVVGLCSIWAALLSLWALWTTDPLKSIGMVIPVVSFLLVLRVWRSLRWEIDGSWWGLVVLVVTALLVRLREQTVMTLVLFPQWSLRFPPFSVVMLAYGVGAALLVGGPRLVKRAVFPLLLLLLVNPVPHIFNVYVDLPLQRASAHIARAFAMALGQPLSPDKLRLMFTPEFGMFIAPGCNGIRGAVTMGLIALVAGYLYRFRWKALTLVVCAAILLGYLFNFVRLCTLVLFYLLALHIPSLQDHAENADYLIGAALFFVAVYLLYYLILRLGSSDTAGSLLKLPVEGTESEVTPSPALIRGFYLRTALLTMLGVAGLFSAISFFHTSARESSLHEDEHALGQFPQTLGEYTLTRSWNESLLSGALLFHWADYAPAKGGTHIQLGISPLMGSHDTMVCHSARGEDPLWHGETTYPTVSDPIAFSTSLYNDGATQYLEASTLCNGSSCGEYSSPRTHFGFVYSHPDPRSLLDQSPERPIPILLKAETIDTTLPVGAARQQLSADMASFLSTVNLDALTRPYRRN